MRIARIPRGRIVLLALFIGSHIPLVGCTDNSSGTHIEFSDKAIAHRDAKAKAYKGGPPKKAAKGVVERK